MTTLFLCFLQRRRRELIVGRDVGAIATLSQKHAGANQRRSWSRWAAASGADLAACWQPESSREAKTAAAIFFNVTLFSLWNRNGALISFAVRRRFAISGLF
ncbi:hypothetical protein AN414_17115 [Serratia marcescens]|nr:hypothetical protein AN414_17115 [Serratia marcescens]